MAILENNLSFTGTISNIVAYRRRDMDQVILRSKGGPSKRKIKTHPHFDITRRNNREFGGRSTVVSWIRQSITPLLVLSDYNIAGPLNSLLKPVQEMDKKSELGKRSVALSVFPSPLEGFQINKRNLFESVVSAPLSFDIQKPELKARVQLPMLLPGVNFFPVDQYPVYR